MLFNNFNILMPQNVKIRQKKKVFKLVFFSKELFLYKT